MKKQIILTFLALGTTIAAFAQGINFETGDWKSVVAKAKESNRLIYVDVYTTWCGPCKMLEKQVFPKQAAGDKFNTLFINYRIDAEKGEGIDLAKKYAVNGYPTHLFVDPASEVVVYRDMGATTDVEEFNKHADIALKEQKDPMTWDKYVTQRKAGKKDQAFLKAYLNKANLLKKNNDAILNDYVATLNKSKVSDEEIIFLADMMQTVDNNALPLLDAHKNVLNKHHAEYDNYFKEILDRWVYGTFEKAVAEKNVGLLKVVDNARTKYLGKTKDAETYYFRTQYYTSIGDEPNAFKYGAEEADYITAKSAADYAKEDAAGLEDAKKQIKSQLEMMKTPADKIDELVAQNIKANPAMMHSASVQAASKLNNISWQVYEKKAKDQVMVKKALAWSDRSLALSAGTNEWASFADTYAHLLYVSGNKTKAIATQQEAVDKSRAANSQDTSSLEESLQKMKDGTL